MKSSMKIVKVFALMLLSFFLMCVFVHASPVSDLEITFDKETLREQDKTLYNYLNNCLPSEEAEKHDLGSTIDAINDGKDYQYNLWLWIQMDTSKNLESMYFYDTNDNKFTLDYESDEGNEFDASLLNKDGYEFNIFSISTLIEHFKGENKIEINFEDGSNYSKTVSVNSLEFPIKAEYSIIESEEQTIFDLKSVQNTEDYDLDIWACFEIPQELRDDINTEEMNQPNNQSTDYNFESKNGIYTIDYVTTKQKTGYELCTYNRKFIDTRSDNGPVCKKLKLTSSKYDSSKDLVDIVKDKLGNNYTIADWNDLKAISDIDSWISCMGLEPNQTFIVTKNGNFKWSGDRQYFVKYAPDGNPGDNWAPHGQIADKLFLGSWYVTNHILAKKVGTNTTLSLFNSTSSPGSTATMNLTLKNSGSPEVAAISTDITYDNDVLGSPSAELGPAGEDADKTIVNNPVDENTYRVGVVSPSNSNTIPDGVVAKVSFDVDSGAETGTETEVTQKTSGSDTQGNDVDIQGKSGIVSIGISCLGDCNANGEVSIAEVQTAINQYLGKDKVESCNDENGDGSVSISEVQTIINNYLEGCDSGEPQPGDTWTEPNTGMEFVYVPSGCYQMGCNSTWSGSCNSYEKPVHEVCVDGFWISKYEVTQGQWKEIMGNNPSYFDNGDNYPVEKVSWNDCQDFIDNLNSESSKTFRLPTEAEWEYAARSGGKQQKYAGGGDVDSVAWYGGNSGDQTHEVGTKAPNDLGIYDMSGNVWEWCSDWYSSDYYSNSPKNNPQGPSSGSYRVGRGGGWDSVAEYVRAVIRVYGVPSYTYVGIGLRLVRTAD